MKSTASGKMPIHRTALTFIANRTNNFVAPTVKITSHAAPHIATSDTHKRPSHDSAR